MLNLIWHQLYWEDHGLEIRLCLGVVVFVWMAKYICPDCKIYLSWNAETNLRCTSLAVSHINCTLWRLRISSFSLTEFSPNCNIFYIPKYIAFAWIADFICINSRLYLYKLQIVFVLIIIFICPTIVLWTWEDQAPHSSLECISCFKCSQPFFWHTCLALQFLPICILAYLHSCILAYLHTCKLAYLRKRRSSD